MNDQPVVAPGVPSPTTETSPSPEPNAVPTITKTQKLLVVVHKFALIGAPLVACFVLDNSYGPLAGFILALLLAAFGPLAYTTFGTYQHFMALEVVAMIVWMIYDEFQHLAVADPKGYTITASIIIFLPAMFLFEEMILFYGTGDLGLKSSAKWLRSFLVDVFQMLWSALKNRVGSGDVGVGVEIQSGETGPELPGAEDENGSACIFPPPYMDIHLMPYVSNSDKQQAEAKYLT